MQIPFLIILCTNIQPVTRYLKTDYDKNKSDDRYLFNYLTVCKIIVIMQEADIDIHLDIMLNSIIHSKFKLTVLFNVRNEYKGNTTNM